MTVAEKMKAYRRRNGYSIKVMSLYSGASVTLLKMVENGLVTHPKIALQIAKAYQLDPGDEYELMPENYRPGPNYNPDKYKPVDEEKKRKDNNSLFRPLSKDKALYSYYLSKKNSAY